MPLRQNAHALRCPMCGKAVLYLRSGPLPEGFPFCGERCKMTDLSSWFDEEYVLGRELEPGEWDDAAPGEPLIKLQRPVGESRLEDADNESVDS